jgi:CTP synthase (UTP-ammonia lyase)
MEILGEFTTSLKRALEEIDPNWESYEGVVICGTHAPKDVEKLISRITEARKSHTPYLGICHGHQLYAIEYARTVKGIKDATSEEFGNGTFVVKKRSELKVGLHDGETYWNNYEVAIEIEKPDFFLTTQSHPEYQSSIDKPHPLLIKFLNICKNKSGNVSGPQH